MNQLRYLGLIVSVLSFSPSTLNAELLSGYHYLKPETRVLQDDDFENPGLFAVENGEFLFNQTQASTGKSCVDCHDASGEKLNTSAIARYPVVNHTTKDIISLQTQISRCRTRVNPEPLPVNHADMIALETFVRYLAKGEKVNVQTDGAVAPLLKEGEALYKQRYGLIDMSCSQCHGQYAGQMIRGQKISQGQANGFPVYRLDIGEMTSLNQRITQCLNLMRAEPFPDDSRENKLLELYLMSRSNGLPIETPAVRY